MSMLVRLVILSIWKFFDPFYFSLTRLQYLCPERKNEGVLRVRLIKYKGKNVTLSDGKMICKNDFLIKIHLHNIKLLHEFAKINNEILKSRGVFKQVLDSMPLLASFIQNHPEESKIKGILGVTLINKGFRPLGFECVAPDSKLYCWFKKTSQLPIYLLSWSRVSIANIKKHKPVYLMMSKDRLLSKYRNRV